MVPDDMEENEGVMRGNFEETGYDSLYATVNLGMTFVILVGIIMLCIFLKCTNSCKEMHPKFNTRHDETVKKLYWNTYLRFIIEGSLEIIISTSINIEYWHKMGIRPISDGTYHFMIINTCAVILLTMTVIATPFFILGFYLPRKDMWCFTESDDDTEAMK